MLFICVFLRPCVIFLMVFGTHSSQQLTAVSCAALKNCQSTVKLSTSKIRARRHVTLEDAHLAGRSGATLREALKPLERSSSAHCEVIFNKQLPNFTWKGNYVCEVRAAVPFLAWHVSAVWEFPPDRHSDLKQ